MLSKYNEKDLAIYILNNGFTSNKKFYELSVVARHLFSEGVDKADIKQLLITFCERYFENFNYVKNQKMIDSIIKNVSKYSLRQIGTIEITDREMELINSAYGFDDKKMLFTLLCLLKVNLKSGGTNFINESIGNLRKICHITSNKKIMQHIKNLSDDGLIRVCINGAIECLFEPIGGKTIVKLNDIDNAGLYYINYKRGGYKECKECGKMFKMVSNRNTYCESCLPIIKKEQNRKRVENHRKRQKSNALNRD